MKSIKNRRPVRPLLDVYKNKGMEVYSFDETKRGVISIKGKMTPGSMVIDGIDSQPVSALLFTAAFLKGPSEIFVIKAGERPFIDLTLHWLFSMGANIYREDYRLFECEGGLEYDGFEIKVGGDFSTALFPIAAAIVTRGNIRVHGLDRDSLQGDKEALDIFRLMGGDIEYDSKGVLCASCSKKLSGIEIDINHCIDVLPILAVVACFAKSKTVIKGAEITKYKECNRIAVMAKELQKMGGKVEERNDGLVIYPSSLIGSTLNGEKDHRVAMSLMVAAAGAIDRSIIEGIETLV